MAYKHNNPTLNAEHEPQDIDHKELAETIEKVKESVNKLKYKTGTDLTREVESLTSSIEQAAENAHQELQDAIDRINLNTDEISEQHDTDIATVNSRVTDAITTLNSAVNAAESRVNSRVDNIIANSSSTEGNSELIDIRTGADDTTYETAGTAIRTQIKQINDKFEGCFFHRNLFDYDNRIMHRSIGSDGEYYENESYDVMNVPIFSDGGSHILHFSHNGSSSNVRMVCTYDNEDHLIERINDLQSYQFTEGVSYIRIVVRAEKSPLMQIEWDQITAFTPYRHELKNDTRSLQCKHDSNSLSLLQNTVSVNQQVLNTTVKRVEVLETSFEPLETTIEFDERYFRANGTKAENYNWAITSPFLLHKGDIIRIQTNAYGENVSLLSSCNSDGDFEGTLIRGAQDELMQYGYTAEYSTLAVISYMKSSGLKVWVKRKHYPDAIETESTDGYYFNQNGTISSNNDYAYTAPILLPAFSCIEVNAKCENNVSAITIADDSLTLHYPKVLGNGGYYYQLDTFSQPVYVTISYQKKFPLEIHIYEKNENRTEWLDFCQQAEYTQIFNHILCIGDSLTEGYRKSGVIIRDKSYPAYLAKDTGATVTNAGVAGIYPLLWFSEESDKYTYSNYDAVFIFLGTNKGLTDTLSQDVTINGQETIFADTNTGKYCAIIDKIKHSNPDAKIFLVGIWHDVTFQDGHKNPAYQDAVTNNVIRQIAELYHLPFLDIYGSKYMFLSYPKYHELNSEWLGSHFNTISYKYLEKMIASYAGKYISEHSDEYQ